MRRRAWRADVADSADGNTSACAEKRQIIAGKSRGARKYLRVCGEEAKVTVKDSKNLEIPPRMRRRAPAYSATFGLVGNTSAYAEKRNGAGVTRQSQRKYLRVCGEEPLIHSVIFSAMEIPPRMRRRGAHLRYSAGETGNTSAYAEKRSGGVGRWIGLRKYLRVCGEEITEASYGPAILEIPPRMRRRGVRTR